jgi:hypothetical protein
VDLPAQLQVEGDVLPSWPGNRHHLRRWRTRRVRIRSRGRGTGCHSTQRLRSRCCCSRSG